MTDGMEKKDREEFDDTLMSLDEEDIVSDRSKEERRELAQRVGAQQ